MYENKWVLFTYIIKKECYVDEKMIMHVDIRLILIYAAEI